MLIGILFPFLYSRRLAAFGFFRCISQDVCLCSGYQYLFVVPYFLVSSAPYPGIMSKQCNH